MPCCSSEVLLVKCAVISVRPTGLSCILLSSSKRVRSQHGWGLSAIRTSKLACRVISLPHSVLFGRLPCWRVSRRTRCAACGALLAVLTLLPAVPVRFIRARLSGGLQPRGVAFHPCAAFRWLAAARGFLRGLAPVQLFAREALSFFFFFLARGSARAWAFRKLQIGAGVPVVEVVRSFPGKPVAILSQ